jgi:hypothetical protein
MKERLRHKEEDKENEYMSWLNVSKDAGASTIFK